MNRICKYLVCLALGALSAETIAQTQFHEWWAPDPVGRYPLTVPGAPFHALDTKTDAFGNTVVAGYGDGQGGSDLTIVKYGPTGSIIWAKSVDGSHHLADRGVAVVLDQEGNVYCIGWTARTSDSGGRNPERSMILAKLDKDSGNPVWPTQEYDQGVVNGNHIDTEGRAIGIYEDSGNSFLYIGGIKRTHGDVYSSDILVLKVNTSDGEPAEGWTSSGVTLGAPSVDDEMSAIFAGTGGVGSVDTESVNWVACSSPETHSAVIANKYISCSGALAIGPDMNVVVAGFSDSHVWLIGKLTGAGGPAWSINGNTYRTWIIEGIAGLFQNQPASIGVDSANNVLSVAG